MKRKSEKMPALFHLAGASLAFVAGWIGALAVCAYLREHSSFMTGCAAKLTLQLLAGNLSEAAALVRILLAFVLGAGLGSWTVGKGGLPAGLYLSGGAILLSAFFFALQPHGEGGFLLLPLSMGALNAAISLTPISRTTHLTGPLTDLGMGLALGDLYTAGFWFLRLLAFTAGALAGQFFLLQLKGRRLPEFVGMLVPAALVLFWGLLLQMRQEPVPLDLD